MKDHRIGWLDSFRAVAVMAVMLYHLTNPVTAHYPHHDFFLYIFRFGYLGVQLFFMISGFVISYTLERTPEFWAFQVNRFSRLFPAMLLFSLLIFGVVSWLDQPVTFPNAHKLHNLLPGLSFINPQLWSLASGIEFHWINGSYWTLWTEVQFYLLASVLYYFNKVHFFRNLLLVGIGLSCLKYLPVYVLNYFDVTLIRWGLTGFFQGWGYADELFNLCFFIGWFLLGVLFYRLYKLGWSWRWAAGFLLVMACLMRDAFNFFTGISTTLCIVMIIYCGLFFWMIRSQWPVIAGNSFFRRIGMISYGIYLIHEEIGLLLINHFHQTLGGLSFLAPFVAIILLTGLAELSYRWYERPATKVLRRWFYRYAVTGRLK